MSERYDVLTPCERVKGEEKKTFWVKVGSAFSRDDAGFTVLLDALPVNGKLLIAKPKSAWDPEKKGKNKGDIPF